MSFRKIDSYNNIFITADLHLSYIPNRSIQNRGFGSNPIEHTRIIRNNINSVCKSPSDILILNGDCGDPEILKVFLKEITPKNIWICLGNHDKRKELHNLFQYKLLSRLEENIYIKWRDNKFHICHYPLLEWNGMYHDNGGAYHWYGHTHNKIEPYLRSMDCGLDAHLLKPVSLELIVEKRKVFRNVDENHIKLKQGLVI